MANPSSIELVIFDCDGVLIDSEVISANIIVKNLAAVGVTVDLDYVFQHFLGRNFSTVAAKVQQNFATKLPDSFEADYRRELLTAFGTGLRTTQGLESVLANLSVDSCVATSSSPPRTQRALELAGLTDFFGARVFTASEVKNGKPAPDLFVHAAEKMKVPPVNCLVIEDSLVGLEAALSADMCVWRYAGGSHLIYATSPMPDSLSHISVLRNWRDFFVMAPELKKMNSTTGGNDGC